jgi:uncharacterized protein (TIGR02466 family)
MEIQKLFPTPIGYIKNKEFTDRVLPIANEILSNSNDTFWGYSTTYSNLSIKDKLLTYDWIVDYLMKISHEFVDKIGFSFRKPIEFSSLFVSKIERDKSHDTHMHPGCIISGVCYLSTQNCAPLLIRDLRDVRNFAGLVRKENNYESTESVTFMPKAGDIILFESWVPHKVPRMEDYSNNSNKELERSTLVFNVSYV